MPGKQSGVISSGLHSYGSVSFGVLLLSLPLSVA